MSELESQKIITEIINFCTQYEFIYSHSWTLGDVLIWDERSILHRGRPWPYEEPRTMASICVSVGKMMVLKFRLYSNHSINDGSINHFFA